MTTQKLSFHSRFTAGFVGMAALVVSSASALANESYGHSHPSAPEVGTWMIGAGMVALVAGDLLRRKFARKAQRPVS